MTQRRENNYSLSTIAQTDAGNDLPVSLKHMLTVYERHFRMTNMMAGSMALYIVLGVRCVQVRGVNLTLHSEPEDIVNTMMMSFVTSYGLITMSEELN